MKNINVAYAYSSSLHFTFDLKRRTAGYILPPVPGSGLKDSDILKQQDNTICRASVFVAKGKRQINHFK